MKAFLTSASHFVPAICLVFSFLAIPEAFSQNYVLNGSAVDLGNGCYRLTPQATAQSGSVWYQNKLSLASDFSIKADLNFGVIDFNGADGMGFVLQPICNGLGQAGGGLGFGGISPSLAVEFDTYQNIFATEAYADPFEDHIALQQNGNLDHDSTLNLAGPVIMPNLEDGLDHSVVIVWNATTQTLTVDFDGSNVITYTGDIVADIFGGNAEVFWGFTAATGALTNTQSVCIEDVAFEELVPYATTNASCPNAEDGAIDLMLTGGIGPFTFEWTTGDTTEDLTGVPPGAYTVMVKDANGCVSTFNIDVASDPDTLSPMITCPDNISVSTDPGMCSAVVTYDAPQATDNCPDPEVILDAGQASGSEFQEGVNTVIYTATDGMDHAVSCTFTITVEDLEPPVIICPPDTTVPCNVPSDFSGLGMPTVLDNCDAAPAVTFADTIISGDCSVECEIERTWTATDAKGNSASCVQMITKSVLAVIQGALAMDVDGDGQPDPIVLGYSRHTVSIGYDAAACVVGWLPGDAAPATAIPVKGHHVVDPADCLPGPVAMGPAGKLADPLMEYTLLLAIKLRLDPDFGKTPLSAIACDMHPIVFQYMKNDPTVDDLLLLGNIALGNIIGPPHLEHIKDALACIAGTFSLCDPLEERPEFQEQAAMSQPVQTILETGARKLELFPNPAQRSISLNAPEAYGATARIAVYSAQGQLVRQIQVLEMPYGPFMIDLGGQPAGLYWMELNMDRQPVRTAKFILSGL